MENLKDLYLEQEKRVTDNLEEIKHIDLWHEQVSFMAEEHPFKAPAVFFSYRVLETSDKGDRIQELKVQVIIYLFYETFADTSRGSKKQAKALGFLDLLTKINACFHATSGNNFSEMRRVGFAPVETGGAGILYQQTYECFVNDESAKVLYENMKYENMEVETENTPSNTIPKNAGLYGELSV